MIWDLDNVIIIILLLYLERPKPKNAFHYLQAQELRKEKKNNNKKATLLDYKENTHPGKDAKKKKQ